MPHPTSPIALLGPRPPGRPPLPHEEKLHSYSIRLYAEQCEKLRRLGGRHWVAQMLDQTPMPRKKQA